MADQACSRCGKPTSIRFLYELNGRIFCGNCVQQAAQESQARGESVSVIPLIQKSICPCCHKYISDGETSVPVGNLRVCAACAPKVRDWDYPGWLKASLALLLALLAASLMHGRKYFDAGKELYRGERLVEEKHYAEALPHLKATLKVAPESDKGALLAAKAALLSGDYESADTAIQGHNHGHFDDADDELFKEVEDIWKRANKALGLANKAAKLVKQEGKEKEAAKLMHEAATYYPELHTLAISADVLDASVDFDQKDYDGFLALSQKVWQEHPDYSTAMEVGSALACKYAVTSDASYRQQAEEMFEKSKQMAKGDPDALKDIEEFEPRFKYRLETRKIITKQEYDKRFRQADAAKK